MKAAITAGCVVLSVLGDPERAER